ncbi:hypothetical protein Tco_0529677 [Tanacetum coccineum]
MINNGGNGSFRVVFPLVRLVSLLRGFNSSGLHFLNLFNDPRIIREKRIAAYGFERGDGVVRVRMSAQDPYLYLCGGLVHRFEVLAWFSCCRGLSRQKKSHVAFIIDQEKVQAAG